MHEQYRPASTPLVKPENAAPRSSLAAILLGGIVADTIGGYVVSTLVVSLWVVITIATSSNPDTASESLRGSAAIGETLAWISIAMSVVGGYVAASWARRAPVSHAARAGVVSAVSGALLAAVLEWAPMDLRILKIPLAMLGGYLYERRANRRV